ncbi:MAG: NADP-dependent oxidoreductase [Pseudomonadota bacterium]
MTDQMTQVVLAARPEGTPKLSDFRIEHAPVPEVPAGGILIKVLWQSLDPYMRGRMDESKSYAAAVEIGGVMEAGCVGQVMRSDNPRFAEGDIVEGRFGWSSHAAVDGQGVRKVDPSLAPIQTAVGILGMPGITAYVGLLDHGRPVAGETLVVGAATGAVGTLVGQLGKIKGLRVVGVAGGAEKCAYAVDELGFDACIDHYAHEDGRAMKEALAAECPDGVDIYFENIAGKTLEGVIGLMNVHGRIPICGMISQYNLPGMGMGGGKDGVNELPRVWRTILVNRLSVRGFIITDHYDRFGAFLEEVSGYIRDGRIKYREHIVEGIENGPQTFIDMLSGGNFGKTLIKVADPA